MVVYGKCSLCSTIKEENLKVLKNEEEDNGKSVYISLKHSSENVFLDNLPYLQSKRS